MTADKPKPNLFWRAALTTAELLETRVAATEPLVLDTA